MNINNILSRINWFFIIILILISSIGIALLYSIAGGSWEPWASNQIIRISIGLLVLILVSFVHVRVWYRYANYFYLFSIFLILITLFFGKEVSGATRWINLYFFSFQPAELVKIFILLALAKYFHSIKLQSHDIKQRIFFPLLILLIPVFFVFKQPDLGTALIIFFSGVIVLFLSGVNIKTFVLSGIGGLISLPILWTFLKDYQKSRIINFLDQQSNTLGANYHITQSKIALGSGGFFGKGFLEGSQSHLNFIPEMETDFIFSVLGEEFGFLGVMILFFLYFLLIAWALKVSFESKNYFSKIFGISFVASFFIVIFVNIGMVTGIIPVVGVPLPFCSYGGSAILSNFIGFGIILSGYNYRDFKLHNI
ncbi:MAG: Rod shape-determining protein RodA [Alphaproteobacteria bacterium MarineAlpha6_Bin6]|nr:MAG: Rod shape-determining protein RodA [Alphaproteobacteria bacterium MarineAlpha6_Bin6]PPR33444.1 MAG: Rod shape-determining protein RodA [Alphaproteobacteria bacterium MarineAlpha6_Bin5]|tara:strand:- start:11634 stop:12734 length:1101 start_codon:yes stop_codon:yes gene_type:complete